MNSIQTRVAIVMSNNKISYFKAVTNIGQEVAAVADDKGIHLVFPNRSICPKAAQRAKEYMNDLTLMRMAAYHKAEYVGLDANGLSDYLKKEFDTESVRVIVQ